MRRNAPKRAERRETAVTMQRHLLDAPLGEQKLALVLRQERLRQLWLDTPDQLHIRAPRCGACAWRV